MPVDVMQQIAGAPQAPQAPGGQQGFLPAGGAPGPVPPGVPPQAPIGPGGAAQAGAPGQQEAAMQEIMLQADAIFQQEFGASAIELMQANAITPEQEAAFTAIIEQVVGGTTTGPQEFGNTVPGSIV